MKKASNSRPRSTEEISTCIWYKSTYDWITRSHERSATSYIASMALITRLLISYCSWVRSARTEGSARGSGSTHYRARGSSTHGGTSQIQGHYQGPGNGLGPLCYAVKETESILTGRRRRAISLVAQNTNSWPKS
jgi:hypothetical protein